MPTQDEIERAIAEIVPGGKFPASKLNPLLNDMLSFSSELDVYDGLEASGTSMLDTKLTLIYGINLITTSTVTNYACKLPKPVTGRRLTVINRTRMIVKIYPSMAGGRINLLPIDAPIVIPPDGNLYVFNCIENPLPGAWTVSPPAIGQYDSGDISVTTTNVNSYIMAVNSSLAGERQGTASGLYPGYDGLNNPLTFNNTNITPYPNSNWVIAFKPLVAWNAMVKIKVYTNIVYDPNTESPPSIILNQSASTNLYLAGTTIFDSITTPGGGGAYGPTNFTPLTNIISGVGTPGLAPNIGDPGTSWGEINSNWFTLGDTRIGDTFISTDGNLDTWFTRYLVLFMLHNRIGNVKFRFFIEYM